MGGMGAVVVMGIGWGRMGAMRRVHAQLSNNRLWNRRAGHVDGGSHRVQRQCGHQEPDQQCREQTVHRSNQYSTAVFV